MPSSRKSLFYASCLAIFMFGVSLTVLGAMLPTIMDSFGIDKANAGALFFLLSLGMLIGSLLFGPIVDRYGYKFLLTLSCLLILIGLDGLAFANQVGQLQLLVFIIGVAGSIINAGTSALVSDISEGERSSDLSLLGVFYGLGAFSIPLLIGGLSQTFGYHKIISGVSTLVLLPIIFFITLRFPKPKQQQGVPIRKLFVMAKESPLLLAGAFLFFQSGLELTASGWSATYMREVLHIETNKAVIYLSLLMLAMMSARLLLPKLLAKKGPAFILRTFILIGLCGAVLMILSTHLWLTLIGLVGLGFGLAAGFPVILGYVGDRYRELSGSAFGLAFTMALTGSMVLSSLSGVLGQAVGLRYAFILMPASLIMQWIIFSFIVKRY
jgi:MFS transporter, FHS family, glucose/mannose:H+ symporter